MCKGLIDPPVDTHTDAPPGRTVAAVLLGMGNATDGLGARHSSVPHPHRVAVGTQAGHAGAKNLYRQHCPTTTVAVATVRTHRKSLR